MLDHFSYYAQNPLQIFQLQQGGLAIWGALLGGMLVGIPYAMIKHMPLGRFLDAVAPALLIAQIIGRVGCAINGDAYGGITSLPWGFIYAHPNDLIPANLFGVSTHPYPIYEILWNGMILLIIWRLGRYKKDGLIFLSYIALYSVGRFVLTFVRQETVLFWGLQEAQVVAVITFVGSAIAMAYVFTRPLRVKLSES